MKITSKILHYPPYISTRWNYIQAIYLKGEHLIVCLKDTSVIKIPDLTPEMLETIFNAHAQFLESDHSSLEGSTDHTPKVQPPTKMPGSFSHFPFLPNPANFSLSASNQSPIDGNLESPLRFGFGSLENLGAAMHHNWAQSNMPDLPQEILSKIAAVAKIVAPDEVEAMPKPEPHCNCTYCQIARALQDPEEEVNDVELTFQQWEIIQTGERLYSVVNRLDSHEKYSVYLGHPVGCTCGKEGCEHILAVLKS
jgi:hypothetical protein